MQCLGGSPGHCTSQHRLAPALHMLSFENFVKSMPPSLSEWKVTPSFCFAFKIPDDVTASNIYRLHWIRIRRVYIWHNGIWKQHTGSYSNANFGLNGNFWPYLLTKDHKTSKRWWRETNFATTKLSKIGSKRKLPFIWSTSLNQSNQWKATTYGNIGW